MSSEKPSKDLTSRIDDAIRDRIRDTDEFDNLGNPVAAVPASDKYALARQVRVEMEDVEQRLNAICEEIQEEDPHAVVPRYRLRMAASRSAQSVSIATSEHLHGEGHRDL